MKHEVFNQYVDRVATIFNITREDVFSKSKKRTYVDARHLIFYLCAKRPMQITYIQKYMNEAGFEIKHPSIIHGISCVEKRIAEDKDYVSVIKEVERVEFMVNKYNPNAPETEEDLLLAGKLRLLKVRQHSRELKDRTQRLSQSQKSTQQETDTSISQLSQLQKLRVDIIKERSELRDLISKGQDSSTKQKLEVEEPSSLAEKMNEDQMKIFLQELMKL